MESARDEPALITNAPPSLAEDQRKRMRNYAVQMGIRVVAFAVLVPLWAHIPAWLGFTLAAAATVLPGFAVVGANAGRERTPVSTALGYHPPQLAARPSSESTELGEDDE